MDKSVSSDKLVLDENAFFIPKNNFCGELEGLEESNVSSESDICSSEEDLTFLASNNFVQTRSDIEINSGKIDFSEIASVVHVCEDHVDIFCRANSWNFKAFISVEDFLKAPSLPVSEHFSRM